MNEFKVAGRLTKDPELKELENGSKVCNVTVAIERDYKDKEGNKITDFIDFALWNKDAERIVEFSKKGALISLDGSLQNRQIEVGEQKIKVPNLVVTKYKHLANAKENTSESIEETKQEEISK